MGTATRFGRLQTGDIAHSAGDVMQSVQIPLTAASTAANPACKRTVKGRIEIASIVRTVVTAVNASAMTINIGTDASAARFAAAVVSAGAANDRAEVTPASAAVGAWLSTGQAEAVTTLRAYFPDVSAAAAGGTAYVTINYIVRE